MKNTGSYLLLTSLRVYLLKAGCFGIVLGINAKTTNSFWDTEGLSAFLPPIFSFQHFQIAIRSRRHPAPSPGLSYSIVNKNKPIFFTNEVYAEWVWIQCLSQYLSLLFVLYSKPNQMADSGPVNICIIKTQQISFRFVFGFKLLS